VRIVTKKRVAAAVAALAVGGAGMAAYAYWTGGGAGTGSATASNPAALVVNQTNSAITNLFPGATGQALSGNFDNSNPGPVYIANVTAAVHSFSSRADVSKPACTQGDFSITGTATVNANVPAGTAQGSWSGLSVSLLNGGGNQDNCKGVSITIDYTANPS
jgi:hypothetical protein